ncbi:MAG: PA14 domain-containing protein, partial [Tepidisphaeraceae bacterium]
TGLSATYFNNSNFTGTQLTRTDATVNFNFAAGSPGPSIANETFSAVWTGQVQAQFSQTYTFHTLSDDGVRLFVNGQKLIENWTNHPATENSGSITLVAGQKYDIRIEYYENVGNAVMQLRWSGPSTPKQVVPTSQLYPSASPQPPPPGQGLSATYFDNANFTGNSVTHIDPGVNFDFGLGSPAPGIGNETFSVRWQGQVVPQFSQTYTFHVRADDGVRLWVNGQLLVDDFTVHAARETSGSIALVAGQKYDIRLDFFDNFHHAVAELRWSSASTPKQIIPASALVPTSGPTTDALTSTDIGGVSPAGGTTVITPGSAYDITGGAFDVWHNADQFRFLHRQLTGDFDAKVRVESLTNLDEWTKAGLMARESLAANSRNVFALTTPTRYRLTWRSQPAGGSSGAGDGPVAYPNTWLRLRRTGNTFEAFRSTNGVNWTSFGSTTVTMSNTIFVGLAVASHSTGALATARFRDVIV